jgi:ubiquinone/menaquinone biosynthesis C-methylase UbiE
VTIDDDPRIRSTYDAIASAYAADLRDELDDKPFDRSQLIMMAELCRNGVLADVGCGPGHVTDQLAGHHRDVIGIDLSPEMINIARAARPDLTFEVGSMLELPVGDHSWQGIVAFYSIIHFGAEQRARAFAEFARVIRPGGWLLLAFHVDSPDFAAGSTNHLTHWFGADVDLDGYFLDDAMVAGEIERAGWQVMVHSVRQPMSAQEYPSRRCYLLARH